MRKNEKNAHSVVSPKVSPNRLKLSDLQFDRRNANKGTGRGRKALAESLKEYGAGRSILLDNKNRVIAGNKTLEQAIAAGHKDILVVKTDGSKLVAVQRVDLDLKDKKAKALAIADNRVAELDLEWDPEVLAELGEEIDLSHFWSANELEKLLGENGDSSEAPEPQLDRAAELERKWKTKRGQFWVIGAHRLLCGDSSNQADVARVWATSRNVAAMMVTDPPYGVEYDPKWRAAAGVNKNQGKMGAVRNDDRADWREAWELFPGDVCYVWHAGRHAARVQASIEAAGFEIRSQIIWAKDRFALSRGDYHWQHEPCWYAVRKGAAGHWGGDRSQSTLWEIAAREGNGIGHGTQKPLECMARPIRNHDFQAVYDPFLGSGTTMVACEKLKRSCYAIEIEPKYVAVVLERLSDMGLKPKLA